MSRLTRRATLPLVGQVTRNVDAYVPVAVEVGASLEERLALPPPHLHAIPLYWRLIDAEHNLVEVAVDRQTGGLRAITLVMYRGPLLPMGSLGNGPSFSSGVPQFGLELWSSGEVRSEIHDMKGRCRVEVGSSSMRLVLCEEPLVHEVNVGDGLTCGFGPEAGLSSVLFSGMSSAEMRTLHQSLTA